MFKKLLRAVTAAAIMAGAAVLMSVTASAYTFTGEKNSDGTMTVTGYQTEINFDEKIGDWVIEKIPATLNIPSKIDGKKVTKIGSDAFSWNDQIKKVVIPEGVTEIGTNAFYNSTITEAVVPSTLKVIGSAAFFGCDHLKKIDLGNKLTTIEDNAFCGCAALTSVQLGNSLKSIGGSAFSSSGLKTVSVPNSVTELGWSAFSGCPALKCAYIGSGVETLPSYCFYDCGELTYLYVGSVKSIEDAVFSLCSSVKSVVLSDTVTYISPWAFSDAGNLVVSAPAGSYAESFCEEYNVKHKTVKLTKLSSCTKTFDVSDTTCTGNAIVPKITITRNGTALEEGPDYKVVCVHNKSVGTATVTVYARGNYTGCYSKTFKITALDLTSSDLKVSIPYYSYAYRGRALKPTVTVKYKGKKVDPSIYSVSFKNNVKPGTADIILTGKGSNSTGEYKRHFKVTKLDLTNDSHVKITIPCAEYMYRGRPIEPTVSVKFNSTLIPKTDYDVKFTNNTEIGTAYITVTAKGSNTTGKLKRTFAVTKLDLSKCSISIPYSSYSCTGSAVKPVATVKLGKTTIPNANFTLTYSNNKNVGEAAIKATAKGGKTTGTLTRKFNIKPGKTTATKIANYNNKITLSWKKAVQAEGYEIRLASTESDGKKVTVYYVDDENVYKTVKGSSATSTSFTPKDEQLWCGYAVRAYKTVNGKKWYGNYAYYAPANSVIARINGITPSGSRSTYTEVNVQGKSNTSNTCTLSSASMTAIQEFAKKYFKSGMTNGDKIKVTLEYIRTNFVYNKNWATYSAKYKSGCYANNALVAHLGQCNDYNGAITEMLTYLGYDPKLVIGYVYDPDNQHYWTEITIGKQTYLLEGGISYKNGKTVVNFKADCALYSEFPVYYKNGKIAS